MQDSVFLITGGASGLGAATATRLVEQGARVVIADMNEELGSRLAESFNGQGAFLRTNVTDEAQVQAAIDLALERFGALHGAVNCAGVAGGERILNKNGVHALSTFNHIISVNLIGTFNVIRLAAAAMNENQPNAAGERGVVINTASVAAYEGQIGQAAYSASKGGIVAMTLPIARDLARSGIRVCTIAPGLFETPIFNALPEDSKAALSSAVPFPSRLGHPSEYAQLAQQIVENPMLNGETIRLDGALRMAPR
ncbi:putative oxidoreductase [compost metagenome]